MPEQLTKHPEVTLQVLRGAGARCGPGVEPKILTKCPPQRFCAFDSGEICVYGLDQIPRMTQISVAELAGVVCAPSSGSAAGANGPAWPEASTLGLVFLLGLGLGALYNRFRRR
jgi:hypothetical protein